MAYRILITSDIHDTDLETWYGVSNAARLEHWLRQVLAEHEKMPFDLILIPGDISLDYHANRTPYDKGYSTAWHCRLFPVIFSQAVSGNCSWFPAPTSTGTPAGNRDA